MISTFNLIKLNSLLEDFYKLTKIRITVFDENFQELTAYPEKIASFCQIIRTDAHGHEECRKCDARACEMAAKRSTATALTIWKLRSLRSAPARASRPPS